MEAPFRGRDSKCYLTKVGSDLWGAKKALVVKYHAEHFSIGCIFKKNNNGIYIICYICMLPGTRYSLYYLVPQVLSVLHVTLAQVLSVLHVIYSPGTLCITWYLRYSLYYMFPALQVLSGPDAMSSLSLVGAPRGESGQPGTVR